MTVDWAPTQAGLEDSLREIEERLEASSEVLAQAHNDRHAIIAALIDTRVALAQLRGTP
jgi:hypothetical protein